VGSGAAVCGASGVAAVSSASASATCLASSPASSPAGAGGTASSALGCSGGGASSAGEAARGGACASSACSSAAASASSTAFTGRPDASVATSTYSCAHAGGSGDAIPRPKPEKQGRGPQCGAMRRETRACSCSTGRCAPPGRLARQSGCTGDAEARRKRLSYGLTWPKRERRDGARSAHRLLPCCAAEAETRPPQRYARAKRRKGAMIRVQQATRPHVVAFSRLASSAPQRFTHGGHSRAVSRRCRALRLCSVPLRRRQSLARRR
jgi:hypothetical protein